MKLIQKLGSKEESKTSKNIRQFGLFECPVCKALVEKSLAHGRRNKSCGKKACRKATFTNLKTDTSKHRKLPIISTLPYYGSISAYYNRLIKSPHIKLSEELQCLRTFIETVYVDYTTIREMFPKIPISIITIDNSNEITKDNYKFIASHDEQLTTDIFVGSHEFCCRRLVYTLNVSYAVAVGTIKQVAKTYKESTIVTKYGNSLKTLIISKEDYEKISAIIKYNKTRKGSTCVYLVESEGYVKIGITHDINKRLSSLKTSTPFEIHLLGCWELGDNVAYKIEQFIHTEYSKYKIKLEWFRLNPSQINNIKHSLNNSKEILEDIELREQQKEEVRMFDIKKRNEKDLKDKVDRYEESKRQAREANEKPKIETFHEWDERFAHDRTNQIKSTTTHGSSHTDLYKTWQNMKKIYTVCDEWQTFEPFQKVVEQEYAQYSEKDAARVYPLVVGVPVGPTNYKIESKYRHKVKSTVARVVEKLNQNKEVLAEYASVTEAAKAVDGIASKISAVCNGTRKTHAGFNWRYKE